MKLTPASSARPTMRSTACSPRVPTTFQRPAPPNVMVPRPISDTNRPRSEEHTSELQSHSDLVCRRLLENKKYLPAAGLGAQLRANRTQPVICNSNYTEE